MKGVECRVKGEGFMIYCLGLGVKGLGCKTSNLWIIGLGKRVKG